MNTNYTIHRWEINWEIGNILNITTEDFIFQNHLSLVIVKLS
jgi:hypothetical protein